MRKREPRPLTVNERSKFLAALQQGLLVKDAIKQVDIEPDRLYAERKRDELFAEQWLEAFRAGDGPRHQLRKELSRKNGLKTTGPKLDNPEYTETLMEALKNGASLAKACIAAGVSYRAVLKKRTLDDDFNKRVISAIEHGIDLLEDEARRRGVEGVEKPIYYQGDVCGYVTEYSDALLAALLKMKRYNSPDVNINNFGGVGPPGQPKHALDLSKLNGEELMWLERILAKAAVVITADSKDYDELAPPQPMKLVNGTTDDSPRDP